MSTWSLRQIDQASGLRANVVVDTGWVTLEEIRDVVRDELFRVMRHEAHPFVIEIHPGDLEFREQPDEKLPWRVKVECRWHPSTHEIELRGGHRDGDVLEFAKAPEPIRVPLPVSISLKDIISDAVPELTPNSVLYQLAGWDEDDRRWVYRQ